MGLTREDDGALLVLRLVRPERCSWGGMEDESDDSWPGVGGHGKVGGIDEAVVRSERDDNDSSGTLGSPYWGGADASTELLLWRPLNPRLGQSSMRRCNRLRVGHDAS